MQNFQAVFLVFTMWKLKRFRIRNKVKSFTNCEKKFKIYSSHWPPIYAMIRANVSKDTELTIFYNWLFHKNSCETDIISTVSWDGKIL